MKKLILLFALVIVSCSTEDEPENTETLSGTYFIESIENDTINDCEEGQNVSFNGSKIIINLFFMLSGVCENGDMSLTYRLVEDEIVINNREDLNLGFQGKIINDSQIEITHYHNNEVDYIATYTKN